ncbi:MAG: Holliday junction branch migration protein RuvA [Actinomycetes bacterium]|jgi:Holliday junction DNA helicase RuvA
MIGRLRGVLVSVRESTLLVEVGGVGYEVQMTPRDIASMPSAGEEIVVHTHTHVREDEISLYGFAREQDREMFRILNTASGVGPRVAMALLGALTAEELTRAIVSNDPDALTVAPGVGKRGAQKIVLELAPKLAGRETETAATGGLAGVRMALENLGYTTSEINEVIPGVDPSAPLQDQLRMALQSLGRR